jgi:tetratricopeptide (TPR) repeat protein
MGVRPFCVGLLLVCLGCQTITLIDPPNPPGEAGQLWEKGQAALKEGKTDEAIRCYEQSLAADPRLVRNHLSLAAAYLEKGDDAAACPHLAKYAAAYPEHLAVRAHLAELLLRLKRPAEARAEFERFVTEAQDLGEPAPGQMVHCEGRLMELAQADADEYAEHLHRGIGLYLLARERAALPDPDGVLPTEGLLCKAAGELTLAHRDRPGEARPTWYLHEVWSLLARRHQAAGCLRAAEEAAPFTYLTPAEHRGLQLACHCQDVDRVLK